MSVFGLGTDIVEIARVEQALEQSGERFALRVLTESELAIFRNSKEPGRYLAKRWSAKEAAAKALGTGIGRGISFQHFEVTNDDLGAPSMTFSGAGLTALQSKGATKALLSISDEQHYAMSTVILI